MWELDYMNIQIKKSGIGVKGKKGTQSYFWYSVKQNKFAYFMILPAILAMLIIHFVPMIQGIYISFINLNMANMKKFLKAPFIGLKNYYDLFFGGLNTGFGYALLNTFIYTVAVTFFTLALGIILAMLLNREFKLQGIARTALLMPWVIPSYVVGIVWEKLWRQEGLINVCLSALRIIGPDKSSWPFWLVGPLMLVAIIVPTIWRGLPMSMILMLAGLQSVSTDYYEAAEIDGANGWQKFWSITIPLLKPILSINIMFSLISNIYSYNIVSMMFGNGAGQPGQWGDLIMTNIQRNSFQLWQFGQGAAALVICMIFMLIIVGIWYLIFKDDLVVK